MSIESSDGEFDACLQSSVTVMLLDTWFTKQGDLESYPHIELTSRKHRNPHKIEFPQTKHSVQEEVEERMSQRQQYASLGRHPEIKIAH